MQPAKFTPEIGDAIISEMQGLKQDSSVSADVSWSNTYRKWQAFNTGCYAYIMDRLNKETKGENPHPDHIGIVYKTFAKNERNPNQMDGTCFTWLETLLDPGGVFAGVLPFLYHTTPKEIIADRGFVVHGLKSKECNPGLVWTFLLASRMLWEHINERALWNDVRKATEDKDISLFLTLALCRSSSGFAIGPKGHGQPITFQHKKARSFLQRDFNQWEGQGPFGSSQCLKEDTVANIAPPRILTLDAWVKEMETIKNAKAA